MYYLLAMRSLTQAGTAQKLLKQNGVAAWVVKTPASLSPKGCSNSVKVGGSVYNRANAILQKGGITPVKVFVSRDGVHYSEV